MTDFSSEFSDGKHDERQNEANSERHFPIDVEHHGEENDQGETFLKEVGQIFGKRDASLLDIVDDGGQDAPGGMMLKESDGLANDFGIDLIAQIGDGRMTRVLNFRDTEIFGNAFGDEKHDEGEAKNRPDVVKARGEEFVEIDGSAARQRKERKLGGG